MTKIRLPMPTYNCFAECAVEQADNPRYKNAHVDSRIEPLIVELGRKRPHWKFIAYQAGIPSNCSSHADHKEFYVEDDGERLGELSLERNWRTGETSFAMDNRRLRHGRQRSGPTKTIHLKKAVKLVLDNYVASTIPEIVRKAHNAARDAVESVNREAILAFNDCMTKLREPVASCIVNDPALMTQLRSLAAGATQHEALDRLPEACERRATTTQLFDAVMNDTGATITLARGKYLLANGDQIQEHTTDTLPDWIKRGVGMLKLVDKNTFIPGTGMRVDADTFFVINTGE